ncbi:hypothetical protein ACFL7E_05780 [Thermodesulfobacteriota bacterium]
MGWLGNLLKMIAEDVAGAPPIELTFVPSIPAPDIPGIGEAIEPDSCYIELYLESLRLARARQFGTLFHGVAYSFVTLSREGEERAQLAAVSKPEKLSELDKSSLDHVIIVSKQMMGPTAFRGGPVSLEFGLFSVKSGNLLTPILDYITRVSSTAGISYVGAIKPFVPLITEGMDLIAGQLQDTALEVGVDTDLTLDISCAAAIIARPKGSIDPAKLSLDEDRRLLLGGKFLNCGYAVFSLRRTLEKSDYGEIPELKERYAAIQSAIKGNKMMDARDALTAFRLATVASPDLISSDARRLVEKANQKFKEAFPPGGIAALGTEVRVEKLSEIGLYD